MQSPIVKTQYKLTASDLEVVLALTRAGTLADAGERLAIDGSTVFRTVQRIEKGLGLRLFERSRTGFQAMELAQELANHAETIETQLESARSATQAHSGQVSGTVKITTTDTILHGLLAPALKSLQSVHPFLSYELHAGNELANLTRRDSDIALRATKRPPSHLVGKHLGAIRMAVYASKKSGPDSFDNEVATNNSWIAPDDALPDHPSVIWRNKHFPKITPTYRVNSILTVAELVAQGMGIGLLPTFLAAQRNDLAQLTDNIEECQTELWLLTHTETRHLRRIAAVYSHLAQCISLP